MGRRTDDATIDYYAVLGVPASATLGEIRKAYRRLAKKYRPDLGGDHDVWDAIGRAYEVLEDSARRAAYDRARAAGADGSPDEPEEDGLNPPHVWIDPAEIDFGRIHQGLTVDPVTVRVFNSGGPFTSLKWERLSGPFWLYAGHSVPSSTPEQFKADFAFSLKSFPEPGPQSDELRLIVDGRAAAILRLSVEVVPEATPPRDGATTWGSTPPTVGPPTRRATVHSPRTVAVNLCGAMAALFVSAPVVIGLLSLLGLIIAWFARTAAPIAIWLIGGMIWLGLLAAVGDLWNFSPAYELGRRFSQRHLDRHPVLLAIACSLILGSLAGLMWMIVHVSLLPFAQNRGTGQWNNRQLSAGIATMVSLGLPVTTLLLVRASSWNRRALVWGAAGEVVALAALLLLIIGSAPGAGGGPQGSSVSGESQRQAERTTLGATRWSAALPDAWQSFDVESVEAGLLLIQQGQSISAYDANGHVRWRYREDSQCGQILGGARGTVVMQVRASPYDCHTIGLSANTGHRVWAVPNGGAYQLDLEPSIMVDRSEVYELEDDANANTLLASYDATSGRLLWRSFAGWNTGVFRFPVSVKSYVLDSKFAYLIGDLYTHFQVEAVDRASGRAQWTASVKGHVVGADGTHLFVLGNDGSDGTIISAISATSGRLAWRYVAPAQFATQSLPSLVVPNKGSLLLANGDGRVSALDRDTGRVVWSNRLPNGVDAGNAVPASFGVFFGGAAIVNAQTGGIYDVPCDGDLTFAYRYGLCLGSQSLTALDMRSGKVVATLAINDPKATLVTNTSMAYVIVGQADGNDGVSAIDLTKLAG